MDVLKPCPFCGGKAKTAFRFEIVWVVVCTGCTAIVEGIDKESAINAWNRRVKE